jgi:signal transduction histidine kinase/ActR/RegA family two-component response regulator
MAIQYDNPKQSMSGIVPLSSSLFSYPLPRWRNLRGPVLLLLSAVIPIVLMGGVLGFYFAENQKASLEDGIARRAGRYSFALSRFLQTQVQLLSVLSESPRLDPPLQADEFSKIGTRLRARLPEWDGLRVSDVNGKLLVVIPQSDNVRPSGTVVDVESHRRIVETGSPVIGNTMRGPLGLPDFAIRVPVRRHNRLVSVVSAVISPVAVLDVLQANGLPKDWVAWVTDGDGKLVTASMVEPGLLAQAASRYVTLSEGRTPGFNTAVLGSGAAFETLASKVEGTGWTVYVGMPLAEFGNAARTGVLLMVGVGGLALMLSLAAVFLFLRELRARRRDEEELASWQRLDALGKLTGGIAHDINNLLMVFQSGAETIQRRRHDASRVDQVLEGMKQAVVRGQSLTHRLLQFSRRSNHDAETVSLYERSLSLTDMLRQAAQDKVQLVARIEPELWPVTVDLGALETALINLVTNAREAMPDGGSVTLTARNVPELSAEGLKLSGPGVALGISDEGEGIAPDILRRVFEPFFTTKTNGSPGLGLSQVYSLAVRSGGAVTVSSVPGRGSAFTIYLPRARPAAGQTTTDTAAAFEMPKRVLVVDDTSTSLAVTQSALQDFGLDVVAVQSGAAALDALRTKGPFQVLLSDIRMPGMSGLQLAESVGRLYPGLGVALMTGYSEELEAGAHVDLPVLKKPFAEDQLLAVLREVMSRVAERSKVVALPRR